MAIDYKQNIPLDVDQVIQLYKNTSLGERRPVERRETFVAMIQNANLIITAWDGATLVGIARALTDFAYVTYLADLAVDQAYQQRGIGKALLAQVQQATEPECMMVLLAAPQANDYYPKLGFTHNPRAWMLKSNY